MDVGKEVISVLEEKLFRGCRIERQSSLKRDLNMNWLDSMALVQIIREEFGITLDNFHKLKTVNDIINSMNRRNPSRIKTTFINNRMNHPQFPPNLFQRIV